MLTTPDALNQHITIGGPEPISHLDAVAAFERVTGSEIPERFVAPGEPIPGAPEAAAPMAPIARTYGVELTSVDTAVRHMLARAAG